MLNTAYKRWKKARRIHQSKELFVFEFNYFVNSVYGTSIMVASCTFPYIRMS